MNTLISIFGSGFAASTVKRAATADARTGYPTDLACVAVEINGSRVPLTYVQADQINAQAPTGVITGPVNYRVLVNNVPGPQGTLTIVSHAPAFFTSDGKMVSAAAMDGTYLTPETRGAWPGETIQLYATGLGPTEPVWQAGEVPTSPASVRDRILVFIDGETMRADDVRYAGVAPNQISGMYLITVRLPMDIRDGNVPVQMSVGGINSPAGTTVFVKR